MSLKAMHLGMFVEGSFLLGLLNFTVHNGLASFFSHDGQSGSMGFKGMRSLKHFVLETRSICWVAVKELEWRRANGGVVGRVVGKVH